MLHRKFNKLFLTGVKHRVRKEKGQDPQVYSTPRTITKELQGSSIDLLNPPPVQRHQVFSSVHGLAG